MAITNFSQNYFRRQRQRSFKVFEGLFYGLLGSLLLWLLIGLGFYLTFVPADPVAPVEYIFAV